MVDSARFSDGRSNFSQTCSLLSRYLKENGSFGDIGLSFTRNLESKVAPTQTMDLLPMIEKSGCSKNADAPPPVFPEQVAAREEAQKKSDLSGAKFEAETAPMTIFYGGNVIVFNGMPANKAKEIMMLAHNSSAATHHRPNPALAPSPPAQSPAESASSVPNVVSAFGAQERPLLHPAPPSSDSDLPIARKNSLTRFLEKRKDRITANAPYAANKPPPPQPAAPPKSVKTEPWLGLSPNSPHQTQRH